MVYRGLTLDPFQREAIEYIEEGKSVLVAAPTGTGKTLIADYLIEEVLEDGGEVIYTAPVKALSNQKYREYCRYFGRDKVGLVTGDLVINRDAPVRIMTTEILRNMLLEGPRLIEELSDVSPDEPDEPHTSKEPDIDAFSPSDVTLPDLANLRAVIIDEIHFLDDEDRGTVWEELLIYLPSTVRILGLSATLSNLEEFADWLTQIRDAKVEVVLETERAVPLELKVACKDIGGLVNREKFETEYARWQRKNKRQKKKGGITRHIDILKMLGDDRLPALFFIYSRKMVEMLARKLAKHPLARDLNDRRDRKEIDEHLKTFDEEFPGVMTRKLRRMYRRGIAFHHAGLHVALKALVEELYEARLIRMLYCTSTFAMGINMPARTVIFDSLTRFNGTDFVPLRIREFMQMAGRSGRRGIDPVGTVVIRQDFQYYDEVRALLKRLLTAESEPVESSFNLTFHSVVNLVDRFDEESIRFMLNQSFKAYQDGQMARTIEKRINDLEQEGGSRAARKELAALRRELALLERPRLWEAFSRKVSFLKKHGYLEADNSLNASARILSHIKIEEIFVTELIVGGVFEELTADEIFGIMVGLVQSLPRRAKVYMPENEKWFELFDKIDKIHSGAAVQGAEELMDQQTTYTPELMPLGERWAKGDSLAEILDDIRCRTDLAGDLVGGFRRAKDLVSQIRQVHRDDEDRWLELTELLRKVTRDEVRVLD